MSWINYPLPEGKIWFLKNKFPSESGNEKGRDIKGSATKIINDSFQ